MIGLAIGAAALFGIVAARRAYWHRACAHGFHGHHHGRHWGPPWAGGWHHHDRGDWGHGRGRRAWTWAVLERLDLSPAQEKLVRQEIEQVVERIRGLRTEAKAARDDLGRAVGGETFDRSALDAMFERQDTAIVELRAHIAGALGRIHEALDSRQREALSDLLAGGLFRGAGFGGPYRM